MLAGASSPVRAGRKRTNRPRLAPPSSTPNVVPRSNRLKYPTDPSPRPYGVISVPRPHPRPVRLSDERLLRDGVLALLRRAGALSSDADPDTPTLLFQLRVFTEQYPILDPLPESGLYDDDIPF